MPRCGFYDFRPVMNGNERNAAMVSAREETSYEYWCDGECVRVFTDKDKAVMHYKRESKKAPTSLHTIFKVVPTRKAIVQWVP